MPEALQIAPNPSAVLFDLDGTLIDTARTFHRVINAQLEDSGRPPISYAALRTAVSEGARAMVMRAFDIDESDDRFAGLRADFLRRYHADIAEGSCLFNGMDRVLEALEKSRLPWGLVTNKPRHLSEALLEKMALDHRMNVLICPEDVSRTKPDPEPMLKAADILGLEPENIWYVGDHSRDIVAGQRAGMVTFAAAYGYLPEGQDITDWQADFVIEEAADLLPHIFHHQA